MIRFQVAVRLVRFGVPDVEQRFPQPVDGADRAAAVPAFQADGIQHGERIGPVGQERHRLGDDEAARLAHQVHGVHAALVELGADLGERLVVGKGKLHRHDFFGRVGMRRNAIAVGFTEEDAARISSDLGQSIAGRAKPPA